MTIGEKICKLRKQKGLSQEAIATTLGVSRQAVSKWERNESLPDLDNVKMLCSLFEVSIDYLVNEELVCDGSIHTALPFVEVFKEKYRRKYNKWFLLVIGVAFVIVLFNQIMHTANVPLDSFMWRFAFCWGAPMRKLWAGVLLLVVIYVALIFFTKKPTQKGGSTQPPSKIN